MPAAWLSSIVAPAVPTGGATWLAVAAAALAIACAAVSPLVVARRWAFVGEGISHSGFGGAGTVWLLSLAWPALQAPAAVSAGVAAFSLIAAVSIGKLAREERLGFDAAVGIFLAASFAWGFLGRELYRHYTGTVPVGSGALLFGSDVNVGPAGALAAAAVATAIVAGLVLWGREIVHWAFDPELAQVAGVRSGVVHYALLLAVAATTIVGAHLVGVVLVTALLVLPGSAAALLTHRLGGLFGLSLLAAGTSVAAGAVVHAIYPFVPLGPAVVLTLFALFLLAAAVGKLRRS